MDYKSIKYKPGKVTQIIINRPRYLNAISSPAFAELEDAFDHAAADPECKVIVHSGAGRCFSTGHDLVPGSPECMPMTKDGRTLEQNIKRLGSEKAAWDLWWEEHQYFACEWKIKKLRNILKPMIAMVHGYCIYGGFFQAAVMDLIFASEDALFLPAIGGYDAGPWFFGERKYKELLFEHRFISAREAYECGLVSRVYPNRDILEKETLAYANRCADSVSPSRLRHIKESCNYSMDLQGYSAGVWAAQQFAKLDFLIYPYPPTVETAPRAEGKDIANVSTALAHLKAKQESEKA